jgi:hypothetical protein
VNDFTSDAIDWRVRDVCGFSGWKTEGKPNEVLRCKLWISFELRVTSLLHGRLIVDKLRSDRRNNL